MTRLIISAFLAVALVAGGAAAILRSGSPSTGVGTAAMRTMQELQANVDKLPVEDFEDRSLEYPRETRRSAPKGSDLGVSLLGP
jgi:hypothetical protein